MAWNSKVVWSEGMLLQPQHLQQHDRYLQVQLETRVNALAPYGYGFSALKIDETQLALGKISLLSCAAILPDGTPACLPADDDLPLALDVPADTRNMLVVLALPSRRPGVPEVDGSTADDNFARFRTAEHEACTTLGVARIVERRADNRVVLDAEYCAPSLDFRAAPRLSAFADELVGLLHQRGDALGSRLVQPGVSGAAEIADFLLLQLINRVEPLFVHFAGMTGLHPE
jgi:type VI secretion system protein ImpJ